MFNFFAFYKSFILIFYNSSTNSFLDKSSKSLTSFILGLSYVAKFSDSFCPLIFNKNNEGVEPLLWKNSVAVWASFVSEKFGFKFIL